MDDGLAAEVLPNGEVRYWVHIADVSRFVPPGSDLDSAALQRMTTLYLPTGPLMMLPVSSNLAHL